MPFRRRKQYASINFGGSQNKIIKNHLSGKNHNTAKVKRRGQTGVSAKKCGENNKGFKKIAMVTQQQTN